MGDRGADGRRGRTVKNKAPAPVQITAEQMLREANQFQEPALKLPKQKIMDQQELVEYKGEKRKEFEDKIRRNRTHVGHWLKYAAWEESQHEYERARSVFERGMDVDSRNITLWIRYAEMEMKHKNVNHARNIWDRAVAILPRVDQFWYKYTLMEETLGNIAGARQVFERWMQWEPSEEAYMAYIKFERRYKETDRARLIYQRYVSNNPEPKNWIKWAKFEEDVGDIDRARALYEQCVDHMDREAQQTDDPRAMDPNIFISFAKFESRQQEFDRTRAIYKFALEKVPKLRSQMIQEQYSQFEKQHGDREEIEDVITEKRRKKYEEELEANPHNYDTWFDYTRLEEGTGNVERIREVYERAIAQVPPIMEKRFWRRYVYLWLFYAVWEERDAGDLDRAKQVYQACLNIIPHKQFTFGKVWLLYAAHLIRRKDLPLARKTLGMALGTCPKEKLYRGYIELELKLREFDRARTLYQKFLEWNPANSKAWVRFAELERMLGDTERAEGVFEIATGMELDMPEVVWKAYIDFEGEEGEWDKVRRLYEKLLGKTGHVKVWISFANFEMGATAGPKGLEELPAIERARAVFDRAHTAIKRRMPDSKEERVFLLETWKEFEKKHGTASDLAKLEERMPRVVKKRRRMEDSGTWEEYLDYIFPDDEKEKGPAMKLLALAHKWKQQQGSGAAAKEDDKDDSDDDEEDEEDEEESEEEEEDEDEKRAQVAEEASDEEERD